MYPASEELKVIREWESTDFDGLAEVVCDAWNTEYGRLEYEDGSKLVLITGGWSGNEDIIRELAAAMWWSLYWWKSERGGLFEFHGPDYEIGDFDL